MASVNKVILIGNCGRDPEIRYLPSGQAVANVSIATSTRRKNRDTGESVEDTQWHRVTFYDRLAEIAGEYLKKGRQVYIEGRLEYGSYEKDGVKHYTTDIIGDDMQMLGGGEGQRSGGGYGEDRPQRSAAPRRDSAPAQRAAPAAAAQQAGGGFDDFADDDIPF